MDLSTDDHRALALAPDLVVVDASVDSIEWMNPLTGTVCRLEPSGEYTVLRRVEQRVLPVVLGQILVHEATTVWQDPDSVLARRAAAHAIVAVDAAAQA